MSNTFNSLSDDDVRQIALLVETLERSTFDFLQLDVGNLKVTIGKGNAPLTMGAAPSVAAASAVAALQPPDAAPARVVPIPVAVVSAPAAPAPVQAAKSEGLAADGTVAIVASIMGRFYAKPDPGAAPFVSMGATVNEDDTVALIEVMKVFTAVRSGVNGVVTEICVQDAQIIEFGQVLFRIRPTKTASAPVGAGAKRSRK
jgi:acetyl-CoA carboxylase biotin carboxyl carrier protein